MIYMELYIILVLYMEGIIQRILKKKIKKFFVLNFFFNYINFLIFFFFRECMNPIDRRWYRFNDSMVNEIDIKY
jgi:hypothetical protein